ncbi:pyruvate:ferredoxin (flavodoxin) oxidoreductase [Pseudoramibacter sp.]|jgi:pyruvate-ferredoxin/flavodoxin oxidoreductase|uniref:pyruvate:ferredoxin (flavodoxin) oxidoreductase n=1 Tax=Pseudoramibacter sp. TaxID=2034862 RepID=UPI0025D16C6A|nr:pyruvate:ferredoxin (flavodoxin) oxidoreductase [Pseudoramibacter sp.]MCH4072106.1 pyruvate:ferredoxin (flavodoxin) oxidoreductase [Pseudoramibacter sp.]MCH4105876.1 pyruvate:ferredoxin (flavodoxin) oxidoreductase [Pseudoramibacter sp.]
MDGNEAAAYVSYAFTEVAAIYPITPSSPMAEHVDDWAANGKLNIFGQPVEVVEMQSEAGASGSVHGALQSGALTTTYTASQGLLLMIPNMYKIAGEMLPGVFHVSARTLSAHALSIFGDHSDVMGVRSTGFSMIASSSPQEVMDLGAVSHLAAIHCRMPVLHFFDGFRTSHEIQKIDALDYDDLKPLIDMDALKAFRKNSLNPEHPATRGTTVNPDIFFQTREGLNKHLEIVPDAVEHYMQEINKLTGRDYHLFNYYGAEDAERIIVLMGSGAETAREAIDYIVAKGEKVGMINVHLYRPFAVDYFLKTIPKTVKKIAVLDRTKEPGAVGEPLYQDINAIYKERELPMKIVGGRYGLSSKDTTPAQIVAVFDNLKADEPKNNFTIGIVDDVTHTSLPIGEEINTTPEGETSAEFWGMGSDGTVGANKNSIKIIGNATDLYCQAYFVYDSKKSGGLTQSHLRFGKKPIHSPYLIQAADFIACHNPSYVHKYDMVKNLKDGGIFLLNCQWDHDEVEKNLPASMKRTLAKKHAQFYTIDAIDIARDLGLGGRTNTILQSAFFKLSGVIPIDQAVKEMKEANYKSYFKKKGQKVVDMNNAAVEKGVNAFVKYDIPESWATAEDPKTEDNVPEFIKEIVEPMNAQEGDAITVGQLMKYGLEDGTWPAGTTQYEKRGAAVDVPEWDVTKCIQCNHCSLVCPHAAIRPILLDAEEKANAPEGFETKKATGKGLGDYQFRIQVSPYDCTGCGSCVNVCPSKEKSLTMKPFASQVKEAENWTYAVERVEIKKDAVNDKTIKNSQFAKPYFEFSGACAGCGETPYIKLVTQLFGDRMYITNASGCSSAYGGSTPSTPYCTDKDGRGPSWAMSLFEDNAEYAYGYLLGQDTIKKQLKAHVQELADAGVAVDACTAYLEHGQEPDVTREIADNLLAAIEDDDSEAAKFIRDNKEFLTKKSVWAFGGDGWAYDIGYGGLDHVLAAGKDINVLVLDTEVYSNTGGQASKSTNTSAIAKFAAGGKDTKKKDLGMMAMSYGYVYVAQIALGSDYNQALKAIREAEAYNGPSLIICYCPCIEHHMKKAMGLSITEEKNAVDCGYWHLYRYNPDLKKEGKNPFTLDSKEPKADFQNFLMGENRYASLKLSFPEKAQQLYDKAERDAKERYQNYLKLANRE